MFEKKGIQLRGKTHEEYVEELKTKNPNLCAIDKYIDANTKIRHKCLKHNVIWMTTPSRALQGVGCEKCHAEKIFASKTRTHEEYVEQLKRVNPNIVPLEEFHTCKTPILHYCKKHDVTWNAIPDNILRNHGCRECCKEKISIKNSISYEQYQKELQEKFPNIECIGNYINHTTPVSHKCKTCGYEWESQPNYILSGVGCKKCMGTLRRNTDEYKDELRRINPQIELVGEFVNMSTHTLHRCTTHDYAWNVIPRSVINGTGCPFCGREKLSLIQRKTSEEYEAELREINPNIVCVDKYIDSCTKIKVKCLICDTIWKVYPSNILRTHGCPTCNISHGENAIRDWLIDHNIEFIPQKKFDDCKDKRRLPFDFYIPKKVTAIEFDGKQHESPIDFFGGEEGFKYRMKHDEIKTQYCLDNGIKLLRISYKDDIISKLNNFFI